MKCMYDNYTIKGSVHNNCDNKIKCVIVRAYDKSLRQEKLLGETTINTNENYEIKYTSAKLVYPEKNDPNVIVRVFERDETLLTESEVFFNTRKCMIINLNIECISEQLSEYEELIAKISPKLDGISLYELKDEDIEFLAKDLEIEKKLIIGLRDSSIQSINTTIPTEIFYALFKQSLPLDLNEISKLENDKVINAIKKSIELNFVPKETKNYIELLIQELEAIRKSEQDKKDQEEIENTIVYELVGQLIEQNNNPLQGYRIEAFEIKQEGNSEVLGYYTTTNLGLFTFNYTSKVVQSSEIIIRNFKLVIYDPSGKLMEEKLLEIDEGTTDIIKIQIVIEENPPIESPDINDLNDSLQLQIPPNIIEELQQQGIKTLDDIRRNGGIEEKEGDEEFNKYVALLNAHANLYTVSDKTEFNQHLINNNVKNTPQITELLREDFVNLNKDTNSSDFETAQMQVIANGQKVFVDNIMTDILVRQANGYELEDWEKELLIMIQEKNTTQTLKQKDINLMGENDIFVPYKKCNCADCESAISPLAYLADLLQYAIKHVKVGGNYITIENLEQTFLQPFSQLPINCDEIDKQIKQVRIVDEILQNYIKINDLPQIDISSYLIETYNQILNKLGTTYDEIRVLRFEDDITKLNELSERIGIDVTKTETINDVERRRLDIMFLDSKEVPTRLTEENLEIIFGFLDTNREPLKSEEISYVVKWKLEYLYESYKKQDWVEETKFPIIDPNVISEEDIRPKYNARSSCEESVPEINTLANEDPCEVIGGCKNVIDLLKERRIDVQGWINEIEAISNLDENKQMYNLKISEMLKYVRDYILKEFGIDVNKQFQADYLLSLYYKLRSVDSQNPKQASIDSNEAKNEILALNFMLEGFTHLAKILINRKNIQTGEYYVSKEEHSDICKILVYVMKNYNTNIWIQEEESKGVQLSYEYFLISDRKLKQQEALDRENNNRWLVTNTQRQEWQQLLKENSSAPMIDPDIINKKYIKSVVAKEIFQVRLLAILSEIGIIKSMREKFYKGVIKNPIDIYDELLIYGIGINSRCLESLADRNKYGESIKATLEKLNLTSQMFRYLYDILKRILNNKTIDEFMEIINNGNESEIFRGYNNVSEDEWENVDSILVQVIKIRFFYRWRLEEKENQITLSSQFFKIPEDLDRSVEGLQKYIPKWRGTYNDLKNWIDVLEDRIEREDRTGVLWKENISSVELNTLTMLRDILIEKSNALGYDLDAKATWLSNKLLIDMKQGSCLITTRVSQAITTIQDFIYLLSKDELKDNLPQFIASFDAFEEDWKWLGSYATWRSAMFVYLYPENILLPTLRNNKSPVFDEIIDNIRENNRLTPEEACVEAKIYEGYLRDISDLEIMATCQMETQIQEGDCRNKKQSVVKNLVYMFAKSKNTGKIYYSTANNPMYNNLGINVYSYWKSIDTLPTDNEVKYYNKTYVYVQPYIFNEDRKYICLFVKIYIDNVYKLYLTKFNINTNMWGSADILDLPNDPFSQENPIDFDFVVEKSEYYNETPYIALQVYPSGVIYGGSLNQEAGGWEKGDNFDLLKPQNLGNNSVALLELIRIDTAKILLVSGYTANSKIRYRILGQKGAKDNGIWRDIGTGNYIGGFSWRQSDKEESYGVIYTDLKGYKIKPGGNPNTFEFKNISNREFPDWIEAISGISLGNYYITPSIKGQGNNRVYSADRKYSIREVIINISDIFYGLIKKIPAEDGGVFPDEYSFFAPIIESIETIVKQNIEFMYIEYLVSMYTRFRLTFKQAIVNVLGVDSNYYFYGPSKILVSIRSQDIISSNSLDIPKNIRRVFTVGKNEELKVFGGGEVGPIETPSIRYCIYSSSKSNTIENKLGAFIGQNNKIELSYLNTISLKYPGPFNIIEKMSQNELQVRRTQIQKSFIENENTVTIVNLTYLEEAYYFVPLYLALQLQIKGQYESALNWFRTVYDYTMPISQRKISYNLTKEERINSDYSRNQEDWLRDPLNPHTIAKTRRNSYTRYTLISIIKCLLEYGDSEFSTDNIESLTKARELYSLALELLMLKEIRQDLDLCYEEEPIKTLKDTLTNQKQIAELVLSKTLSREDLFRHWLSTQSSIKNNYLNVVSKATQIQPSNIYSSAIQALKLAKLPVPLWNGISIGSQLIQTQPSIELDNTISSSATEFDVFLPSSQYINEEINKAEPIQAISRYSIYAIQSRNLPTPSYNFCIPKNPIVKSLYAHATQNLDKIRNCRNINGIQRQLEPYSAATDTFTGMPQMVGGSLVLPSQNTLVPTPYRYIVLLERAKQLVNYASSIENAFLSSLEKRDLEYYNILKAKQDLKISYAQVKLRDLQVKEAEDNVELSQLQQERAQIQEDHYDELISAGELAEEIASIEHAYEASSYALSSTVSSGLGILGSIFGVGGLFGGGGLSGMYSGLSSYESIMSQINATQASFIRRQQEWLFNKIIAAQDIKIASQQIKISEDKVDIANQEKDISQIQADFSETIVNYLDNKFTNKELYEWMSNVLEGVYKYFLNEATAMAKLAQLQLGFERQEEIPQIIQNDYWECLAGLGSSDQSPDRRGLTGSARLLQDISQLDQYAFNTAKKKLNLSKTISLLNQDPIAFQQFLETGNLKFTTVMGIFERDFPSHYLRLIKNIKVDIIGIVPVIDGVKAILSSTGYSNTIIGGDIFQTKKVLTSPESVALTSTSSSSQNQLEMKPQQDMLLPFEGMGVEAIWNISMPKGSNLLDYNSIADILFTIEYSALSDENYGQQVIKRLGTDISLNKVFSLKHQFADQWYQLNNPDQCNINNQMIVTFRTEQADFPQNVKNLEIKYVSLYFASSSENAFEVNINELKFVPDSDKNKSFSGPGRTINRFAGEFTSWNNSIAGQNPIGTWTLDLTEQDNELMDESIKELISSGIISNIAFVITYRGETLAY